MKKSFKMCGISLAINTHNAPVPEDCIRAMNDKISHRGPDDAGFYFGKNFSIGHRRLSIIDLSKAGHQPMQRNHLLITYNGEVYNYIELREELKNLGCHFETASDTEVILAAYEQWGVEAFVRLNGMWAFAIYDSLANEIICCRDHFGIKPLYFTQTNTYFLAGSEIKQFSVFPDFIPVLNKKVAVNFLTRGWLNYSDQTFFEGVTELRAGHYLRYNLSEHRIKIEQWYDLNKASIKIYDEFETARQKTRELFSDSVRLRMRSDVKVGSCLSGGIDSSSMVSVIKTNNLANNSFATVTSCYKDTRFDEQQFSDVVTNQTGFKSLKVYPDLNSLWDEGHFDKMIYHQDQPFGSASHYSEFCVFRKASENQMTVMLDGQGSDEYFCGYGEFFMTRMLELIRHLNLIQAWKLLQAKASHRKVSTGKELQSFLMTAYGFRMIRVVKKVIGKKSISWLSRDWEKIKKVSNVQFNEKDIRALSVSEIVYTSIPYQLHSEDRNSMMFSIESRLPFLDHRLVEYVIGLPSSFKIKNGYTKYILREAIAELPESIRLRKDKMGFVAPDAEWILQNKEAVRKELEEVIAFTDAFSPVLLRSFDDFVSGKLNYDPVYFRAMAFNRFLKIFKMETN